MSEPHETEDTFKNMTHEDFVACLLEVMAKKTTEELLRTAGAWEVYSEEFNNEVLDLWLSRRKSAPCIRPEGADPCITEWSRRL